MGVLVRVGQLVGTLTAISLITELGQQMLLLTNSQ